MTREELIKKVALKMDEISSSDDVIVSVGTSDNNPLYTQIDSLLNESINDVLLKAPTYRINASVIGKLSSTSVAILGGTRKAVEFGVPNDFLRFISVTDKSFQRPITELAVDGDEISKRQFNKFLVGKSAKPVAVISRTEMGAPKVTCYSYSSEQTPNATLLYVSRYSGSGLSTEVAFDEYLTDIISWACAGKVFAAQGDVNKAKICDENAQALMV